MGNNQQIDKLTNSQLPTPNSPIQNPKSKILASRRPIAIDLFAGAGGFSLGIEQAGFDVLVAVERDPIHAAVYTFNFPQTKVLCADITTLSSAEIRQVLLAEAHKTRNTRDNIHLVPTTHYPLPTTHPEIDLIIGGPPCQGFSIMGKGCVEDERNNLVFHFCRLVTELQPRYFVMENVPGMLTKRYAEFLSQLIAKFEQGGYCITQQVQVLDAADFGVPQHRRRLFLIGSREGETPLTYPKPLDLNKVTVRDAIADLPDLDDFPELAKTDDILLTAAQLEALEASASLYARQMRGLAQNFPDFSVPRLWNRQLLTSCRRTQHQENCSDRFNQMSAGQLDTTSRLRRLNLDGLCHTLRAGTGSEGGRHTSPRPIHPTRPRVISVREAARLHSFPDWFRFHTTKWHGFRQVGNAVPPRLARAIAHQAIATLGIIPPIPTEPLELGNTQLISLKPSEAIQYWGLSKRCYDRRH
jgi:DNA (cytosine-5)-methyltransferase 1